MAHNHSVYDTDTHFVIDKDTREIKRESNVAPVIVQHDHNSERFSFVLERYIDGHDMTLCNEVQVHYLNIDSSTKDTAKGVYSVDDIGTLDGDESKAVCSWLISENATQYAGKLNFMIRFSCIEGDGSVSYRWNTGIYTDLTVVSGYDNGEAVTDDFPDILAQWKAELFGIGDTEEQRLLGVSKAQQAAIAAKGEEVLTEAEKQLQAITAHGEAVKGSIPADYSALDALADSNYRNKAGAIVLDAEGESIVVNDASEYPVTGLKVFGKSTQDGTPSPDAPVDIVNVESPAVAVYGKNLLNASAMTNELFTENDDGSFTFTKQNSTNRYSKTVSFFIPAGTPLTFSYELVEDNSNQRLSLMLKKDDGSYSYVTMTGRTATATYSRDVVSIRFYQQAAEVDGTTITFKNFQIEIGDTATEYEPYKEPQAVTIPHTLHGIPVSSGGNYTDANGQQWICDEVDLKRGVYVQRVMVETVTKTPAFVETADVPGRFLWDRCLASEYSEGREVSMGNFATWKAWSAPQANFATFCVNVKGLYFAPVGVMTTEDVNNLFAIMIANNNPPLIIGQLATPIETALSDAEITAYKALCTNKPNTTILNDAGAYMAVEYVADTKTYIDNKLMELMQN